MADRLSREEVENYRFKKIIDYNAQRFAETCLSLFDELEQAQKRIKELEEIVKKMEPYEILAKIRTGDFTPLTEEEFQKRKEKKR